MSNKFKVGDKVVRTSPDYGWAVQGEEYTVSESTNNILALVGHGGTRYFVEGFTLATPKFKPMKFRVKDEEHSKAIQTYLFGLGYKWLDSTVLKYTEFPYLFTDGDGCLSYGQNENTFNEAPTHVEHTLDYEVETTYKVTNVEEVISKSKEQLQKEESITKMEASIKEMQEELGKLKERK